MTQHNLKGLMKFSCYSLVEKSRYFSGIGESFQCIHFSLLSLSLSLNRIIHRNESFENKGK